jgi:hypothetical protein
MSSSQPRPGHRCKGCPNPDRCPVGRRRLCRTSGSSPRGDLATQVPATPAGEVRRYDKPVRILAGLRHRHYSSWWKHCCNGKLLPCSLDQADLDLAHEPYPGVDLLLGKLCSRFTANFASVYQQHGMEAHLHVVRQEPGETLRAFISRFTMVRGTIPRISNASIITAFRQGVRDKKMLEKLAMHDVEIVTTLFTLADKCARAAEGCAWHSASQTGVTQMGGSGATT